MPGAGARRFQGTAAGRQGGGRRGGGCAGGEAVPRALMCLFCFPIEAGTHLPGVPREAPPGRAEPLGGGGRGAGAPAAGPAHPILVHPRKEGERLPR